MAIKSRIQLKSDTEENWGKAKNFVPLKGEVIIYLTDETHPFSRLKIGDGTTYVADLPFLGGGEIEQSEINEHIDNTIVHVTNEERNFWNNKINCGNEVIKETLLLTRN